MNTDYDLFYESIYSFRKKALERIGVLGSEEATKTSLILPFLRLLGYDDSDPKEVIPEYSVDENGIKNDKVDYAILSDDKVQIIIEAKSVSDNLTNHYEQISKYFSATKAKIVILTNGKMYRFFTNKDSEELSNVPFFEFDIINLEEDTIEMLYNFNKDNIDIDFIISHTEMYKTYQIEYLKNVLATEIEHPDDDFIKLLISYVYDGAKTDKVIKYYKPYVVLAFKKLIEDKANILLLDFIKGENK